MRRVVITGIGAVTPLGNDIETTWKGLTEKRSGIGPITKFDPSGLSSRIAGELKYFSAEHYISKKDIQRLDPFIHYAIAASIMAADDAGLAAGANSRSPVLEYAGIVIGSSRGGITNMGNSLQKHLLNGKPFSAYLMSSTTINMASSAISMKFGIKGPALGISTACASGANAIGEALRLIRCGEIDIAFAGGTEAPLCRLAVGGYASSGALSGRNNAPQEASRPFDKDRDGFVISEGAAILVIEELDHALKRKSKVYAELTGYGISSDAFHQTKPDSKGEAIAIKKALNNAGLSAEKIDYINAHATSSPLGDLAESLAIREVFGKKVDDIHVSSSKSMLGHMLGAAGAVETAITAMSIDREIIIPTANLENPDPACGLNHVTTTINKKITAAITNSFGFGGANAVLVLKKFKR